ncbi:MAG: methyltransferase [candidate division Zixibacteria bacterium]|nr:methyltransferase [candidate division Zixibacteria bacterium]
MTEFTLDKLPKKVLARIDLQSAFMISRCVVAAERLQVFRKLHGKKLSAEAIGRKIGVRGWRIEVFLAALVSIGLLKKTDQRYSNTALADKYYVRGRSIFWTKRYSEWCCREYQAFSVLEKMLTTEQSYASILGIDSADYIKEMKEDSQWANDFTHMLYYAHLPHAKALAQNLDLSNYHSVLDIGGGSGVMSMALVRKYKHLKACVLDIEPVINVARKIIRKEKLTRRIDTLIGDHDKHIPDGFDVMMYCDAEIGDGSTLDLAYESLPKGGLVVLVEDYSSDDWTVPLYRLMWQLRSNSFWLKNRRQMALMLRESGFKAVKSRRIYSDTWLITGRKGLARKRGVSRT